MLNEKSTDVELVRAIKNPNTTSSDRDKYFTILYKRYLPQIDKHWKRLQQMTRNMPYVRDLKSSYMSNASLAFAKTVETFDLSRAKDNNLKCSSNFNLRLMTVCRKLIEAEYDNKENIQLDYTANTDEDESPISYAIEAVYYEEIGYKETPEYKYEEKERVEGLKKAISNCSKRWSPLRKNLIKYYLEGKEMDEIAKTMNITKLKVYSNMYLIRNELRDELEKMGFTA